METTKPNHQWGIIGHATVVRFLQHAVTNQRVAPAMLFLGPVSIGKSTMAVRLAQSLLCQKVSGSGFCGTCPSCLAVAGQTHPDVDIVATEDGKALGIDAIRSALHTMHLTPSMGKHRFSIIPQAEKLTTEAANALLKMLEEPPASSVVVLCSTSERAVPATVRSRCQTLYFSSVSTSTVVDALVETGVPQQRALALARRSCGCPGIALAHTTDVTDAETEAMRTLSESLLHTPWQRALTARNSIPRQRDGARQQCEALLRLWTMGIRDLLLQRKRATEFCVFPVHDTGDSAPAASNETLLRWIDHLATARRQLAANVAPQTVLETLLLTV